MNWKNLPYWVRGGVALVVSNVALNIFDYSIYTANIHSSWDYKPGIWHFLFTTSSVSLNYFLQYLTYLLVGMLLGWLYGKIKNRNKTAVNGNIS